MSGLVLHPQTMAARDSAVYSGLYNNLQVIHCTCSCHLKWVWHKIMSYSCPFYYMSHLQTQLALSEHHQRRHALKQKAAVEFSERYHPLL